MPFRAGTVSYARFEVHGGPDAADASLLHAAAAHTLQPPSVGAPPEVMTGLTAGRHILDESFDPEDCLVDDVLLLGLRIDTARVPADLRRAYRALAEQAAGADGHVGRAARADARDEADERCREELARGQHRRSRHVPLFWHVRDRVVLAPAFGEAISSALVDIFRAAFDVGLERVGAGQLARSVLGQSGATDDLRPSALTAPPADSESNSDTPTIPWAPAHGAEPDFIGNEFLFWLWHRARRGTADIETSQGLAQIALTGTFELACGWESESRLVLHANAPARAPEARSGLRNGKWPRKAGLLVAAGGTTFQCALQGDRFHVTSLRLPAPEEEPRDEAARLAQRMDALIDADRTLLAAYEAFLRVRTSDGWAAEAAAIRRAVAGQQARPQPAAVVEVKTADAPVVTA